MNRHRSAAVVFAALVVVPMVVLFGTIGNGYRIRIIGLSARDEGFGYKGLNLLTVNDDRFTLYGVPHTGCQLARTKTHVTLSIFFNTGETRRWRLFWHDNKMPPVLGASASQRHVMLTVIGRRLRLGSMAVEVIPVIQAEPLPSERWLLK